MVNAGIEHVEAIMMANNRFKPVPWTSVVLACVPGLLIAISRRPAALLDPLLPILGCFCLGLLVLAPIIWWQRRRFPVWALLPAGALMWFLTYMAGTELSRRVSLLHILDQRWAGIAFLNVVLTAAIFVFLLRRQRIPDSIWLGIGIVVFGHVLLATFYSLAQYSGTRLFPGMLQYFTSSGLGPVEGLMLIAVGLLAARQHGVLALLVVVGGYSYMCTDTDYLLGYPLREWTGLSVYLVAVTALYMVVVPVALLRAKTRLGRALAVFVPVVAFHVARLGVPSLVIQRPLLKARPGDVILSINAVLSLLLAWALYSHVGGTSHNPQPNGSLEASPLPN
jgi:hypothetical protein